MNSILSHPMQGGFLLLKVHQIIGDKQTERGGYEAKLVITLSNF